MVESEKIVEYKKLQRKVKELMSSLEENIGKVIYKHRQEGQRSISCQ